MTDPSFDPKDSEQASSSATELLFSVFGANTDAEKPSNAPQAVPTENDTSTPSLSPAESGKGDAPPTASASADVTSAEAMPSDASAEATSAETTSEVIANTKPSDATSSEPSAKPSDAADNSQKKRTAHRLHARRSVPAPTAPSAVLLAADRTDLLPLLKRNLHPSSFYCDLLVVMTPLILFAVYLFGWRVLTITALSILSSLLWELLARLAFRRTAPPDLEPLVIGTALALCLPPTAPLYLPILASFLAIVLFRQLPGGTGCSSLPPVAGAILMLYALLPDTMHALLLVGERPAPFTFLAENGRAPVALALDTLKGGFLPEESLLSFFVGLRPGLIGETSALLLIAGFLYLVCRRVIRPGLALSFLATFSLLAYFFPTLSVASDMISFRFVLYHLFSGNLLLGICLIASAPGYPPTSSRATMVTGVVGATVTILMRYFGDPALSVFAALFIMGLIARPLDYLLRPVPFGGRKKKERVA